MAMLAWLLGSPSLALHAFSLEIGYEVPELGIYCERLVQVSGFLNCGLLTKLDLGHQIRIHWEARRALGLKGTKGGRVLRQCRSLILSAWAFKGSGATVLLRIWNRGCDLTTNSCDTTKPKRQEKVKSLTWRIHTFFLQFLQFLFAVPKFGVEVDESRMEPETLIHHMVSPICILCSTQRLWKHSWQAFPLVDLCFYSAKTEMVVRQVDRFLAVFLYTRPSVACLDVTEDGCGFQGPLSAEHLYWSFWSPPWNEQIPTAFFTPLRLQDLSVARRFQETMKIVVWLWDLNSSILYRGARGIWKFVIFALW